jgi:hypothetical protein
MLSIVLRLRGQLAVLKFKNDVHYRGDQLLEELLRSSIWAGDTEVFFRSCEDVYHKVIRNDVQFRAIMLP